MKRYVWDNPLILKLQLENIFVVFDRSMDCGFFFIVNSRLVIFIVLFKSIFKAKSTFLICSLILMLSMFYVKVKVTCQKLEMFEQITWNCSILNQSDKEPTSNKASRCATWSVDLPLFFVSEFVSLSLFLTFLIILSDS